MTKCWQCIKDTLGVSNDDKPESVISGHTHIESPPSTCQKDCDDNRDDDIDVEEHVEDADVPPEEWSPAENRLTFNVGGTIFQTLRGTFNFSRDNPIHLLDPEFLAKHWNEVRQEYFFDRDPEAFQSVLNYLRTGSLHLPHNMCSSQITGELIYWGIPRIDIEPCCWRDYSMGIQSLENLRRLEQDRQPAYMNINHLSRSQKMSGLEKLRFQIWVVLSEPASSKKAKVHWCISQILVLASIVIFAINSIPEFGGLKRGGGNQHKLSLALHQFKDGKFDRDTAPVTWLYLADMFCFGYFSIELLTILSTCPNPRRYLHSLKGIVEVLALVPDGFTLLLLFLTIRKDEADVVSDLQVGSAIKVFRIVRLFRLFRLIERIPTLMIIVYSLWASIKDLISVFLLVFVASIFFSTLMHYLDDQTVFTNIPLGCWWGIVTMCTVGYGDLVPSSEFGKIIGVCCAVTGVLVLGISAPALVHNFVTYYNLFQYMSEREHYHMKAVKKRNMQRGKLTVLDPYYL